MLIENPTGHYEGDRMPRDAATLVSWWKGRLLGDACRAGTPTEPAAPMIDTFIAFPFIRSSA
jgi:hypothetical protein